jgi:hypothetical protein
MDNKLELLNVNPPPTFRVLSKSDGSHDFNRRERTPCETLSDVEPIISAIDVLECDRGKCDNG